MIEIRISRQQLTCVVGVFSHIAIVLYLPAPLAATAGPDAWLAIPVGVVIGGVPVVLLLGALARYHPRRTFGQICEACLGRWVGRLSTLVMAGFSIFLASLLMRSVMDFGMLALLPGTPMLVVGGAFAALAMYFAYNGAEVIARLGTLILFLTIMSLIVMGAGLVQDVNVLQILPVLGHGPFPVVEAGWQSAGWFAEIWIFGQWIGFLDEPRRATSALLWGLLIAAGFLTLVIAGTILTFGPEFTETLIYPVYVLAQQVRIGEFLERLEVTIVAVWLAGMALEISICLWTASHSLSQTFGLKRSHLSLAPAAATALALALLLPTIMLRSVWILRYWTAIVVPLSIGLLGLLTVLSWWRAWRHKAGAVA